MQSILLGSDSGSLLRKEGILRANRVLPEHHKSEGLVGHSIPFASLEKRSKGDSYLPRQKLSY